MYQIMNQEREISKKIELNIIISRKILQKLQISNNKVIQDVQINKRVRLRALIGEKIKIMKNQSFLIQDLLLIISKTNL
jgi:hypothetical protein